ncbi:MAG: ABC transporter substrate-binding protein [Treponema sp.]|uniref:ABC transporter substrate-binding protein n=1 Tax=Treponema sp. TaxID=166 RepID=UPI00361BA448
MKNVMKLLILTVAVSCMLSCQNKNDANQAKKADEQTSVQTAAYEPVTIETYKNSFTFTKVPERVVSLSFSETQLLVALGLQDKIVGIATAETGFADCLPEYQENLHKLKIISDSTPTFEVLLESNPDFVVGTVYSFTEYGVAPAEDFVKNDIPYYALRGTYVENPAIEDTYKDIENLGKIFKVEERAATLIKRLKEREAQYAAHISKEKSCKVFVYNSGDEKQADTIGKNCLDEKIVSMAGGQNIFNDIAKRYARVSWEEVAVRNPQLIVIYDYNDGITAGTLEEKIAELKNNPGLSDVEAIKHNNFTSVKLIEVFPGLQIFDAIEKIQTAIEGITAH